MGGGAGSGANLAQPSTAWHFDSEPALVFQDTIRILTDIARARAHTHTPFFKSDPEWLSDHLSGLCQSRIDPGCCQPLLSYGSWHWILSVQVEVRLLLVPANLWVLALVLVLRTFQKGKVMGRVLVL